MSISWTIVLSMVIAGGLAGLAGASRHPRRLDARSRRASRPATASTASRSPSSAPPGRSAWSSRRPPLRRPAGGRNADAGRDRHADRPRRHHPGAGDHVHRRPGARPRHLPHQVAAHRRAPKSSPRDGAHDRRRRHRQPRSRRAPSSKARTRQRGPGPRSTSFVAAVMVIGFGLSVEPARSSTFTLNLRPQPSSCPTWCFRPAMTGYLLAAVVAFAGGRPADARLRRALGDHPRPRRLRVRLRLPDVGRPPGSR